MSSNRFVQISTVVPPTPDGIGGAAIKLHRLLLAKGAHSVVVTSSDQEPSDGVICRFQKWGIGSFAEIGSTITEQGSATVIVHYPSPRFFRYLSICVLPLFLKMNQISTILFLHEFVSYTTLGRVRSLLVMLFCQRIIVPDSANYTLLRRIPFVRSKVFLLSTGCNISIWNRDRQPHASNSDRKKEKRKLLFFGLIQEGKGVDVIVDVFERSKALRDAFELRIVGGMAAVSKPSEAKLFKRVKESKILLHNEFLTETDLEAVLNDSDLLLLPFSEGVSERRTTFMTGMAFGKATVTTRPPVPIPGLVHMRNVILLDGADEDNLEELLTSLVFVDDSELLSIGKEARDWYIKYYSDEIVVQRLILLVEGQACHSLT